VDKVRGTVKQFTYRTARLGDVFLRVPRDTVDALERQLADKAGVRTDNHVVYEITQNDNPPTYILFSDFDAFFGHSVREERW
jgi:hypothetical protein